VTLAARTDTILGRFPRHLDAGAGDVFRAVVAGLASDLDVEASQLGRVRRSHRISVADQRVDLERLAHLHDLGAAELALIGTRLATVGAVAQRLRSVPSGPPAELEAALRRSDADLAAVLGLAPGAFGPLPAGEQAQLARRDVLLAALDPLLRYAVGLGLVRRLLTTLVATQRDGSGSVGSILRAAAAYLQLAPDRPLTHSVDRYWHVLACRDLLRLSRPSPDGGPPAALVPLVDLLALEENPFRPADVQPAPRRQGERFSIFRRGFDAAIVTVVVAGIEDRTLAPMVVNVDSGDAVAYTGGVAEGSELRFERDGRVLLDGRDVAGAAYELRGAVFAAADQPHHNDFVWADAAGGTGGTDLDAPADAAGGAGGLAARDARFTVTSPVADALESELAFPHPGARLRTPALQPGETRLALFVGEGGYAGLDADGNVTLVRPLSAQSRLDRSVFADAAGKPPPAAKVGFAWDEREPFAARVWLPARFAALDEPGAPPLHERLRALLDRHRPAGVHLYVEHADDRWTLGGGILRDVTSDKVEGVVVAATGLWPSPPGSTGFEAATATATAISTVPGPAAVPVPVPASGFAGAPHPTHSVEPGAS
jgi:hypothetical protein